MCQVSIQLYEPCACSFTWARDPETGAVREVRIPCVRHVARSS